MVRRAVAVSKLALAALGLVTAGCRCRDDCGAHVEPGGFAGLLQVGTVLVETDPATGVSEFSWVPATTVAATWFAGDQSLTVASEVGEIPIPRSTDYRRLAVDVPGYPPHYLLSYTRDVSYVVLGESHVSRGETFDLQQAARLQGRVANFTPSSADEDSVVRAYWHNLQGHAVDATATAYSRTVAIAGMFTVTDNNLDLYLPPGDNQLFLLERIVRTADPSSYTLAGAAYYDDLALAAGVAITEQTFDLSIAQYSGACGSNAYGYMTLRWPELDRSFIRAQSGAVGVDVQLHLNDSFAVPFFQGKFDNERIRDGNAMRFGFPIDLTGDLQSAYYSYQSAATRMTEQGRDVAVHAWTRVDGLPCDMVAQSPGAAAGMLAPLEGTVFTSESSVLRWDRSVPDANLGRRLVLWQGPITAVAGYRQYDAGTPVTDPVAQPIMYMDIGEADAGQIELLRDPFAGARLVPGVYTLEYESLEPDDRAAAWHLDPVGYARSAGMSYDQWRERSARWISFVEFTIE